MHGFMDHFIYERKMRAERKQEIQFFGMAMRGKWEMFTKRLKHGHALIISMDIMEG